MKDDFYKQIIKESPIGYAYHRTICRDDGIPCDYEFIEVNSAFEAFTGLKGLDIIGKRITEVIPGIENSEFDWIKYYGEIAINGEKKEFEQFSEQLNRWYRVKVFSPEKNYFITYFVDVSEEKINAIKLGNLLETVNETEIKYKTVADYAYDWETWEDETGKLKYVSPACERTERKQAEEALRSNQRQLTDIIEFLPDATLAIDKERRVITWNKAIEKMTCIPASEMIGKGDYAYTIPFYGVAQPQLMNLLFLDNKELTTRYNSLTREGDTIMAEVFCPALYNNKGAWVFAKASPLHDQSGNIIGAIESIRDINEQKLSEAGLKSKAAFLEAQTNASLDGILVVNDDYRRILTNRRIFELFNVPRNIIEDEDDTLLLKYVISLTKDPEQFQKKVIYLYDHINETSRDEIEFKSGMVLDRHSAPVTDKEGKYYGRIWTFHDITDRKRLETDLERERNLLETTLISVADGVISTDNKGNIVLLNRAAESLTGWTQEEARGKWIEEVFNFVNKVTREKSENIVNKVLESGKILELSNHTILISKDGTERFIDSSAAPIKDISGKTTGVVITFRDMTERKISEKLIKESEEKFRTIFEQASVGTCLISLNRTFISGNQKVCEILGYSMEELFNISFVDITYPDDLEYSREVFSKLLNGAIKTESFEKRYIKKDGTIIWVDISVSLFRDFENMPSYFIATLQNITDRKLAEIALVTSEIRLKRAQSIAHVGNWEFDITGMKIWVSEEGLKIHGIEQNSSYISIDTFRNLVVEEDRPKLDMSVKLFIENNDNYDIELRMVRADDGQERIMHSNAILEKDHNGNPLRIVGVIQDITDFKRVEKMLRNNEIKYRSLYHEYQQKQLLLKSLINSIPDLIFYKDKDSVYLGCNKAFESFAGTEENRLIGLTDFDLFDKEMATLFRTMDITMINQNSPRKNEEIVTYPDGSKVYLETLKTPYYDPEGNLLGLIGISRDITERKKKEEEILFLNYHDVLTGLYNRTYFDEERNRLDTVHQLPLSVITGDINGLKLINDAFGHAEGDKLLYTIAKILKSCCREEDIVARTGGDEFSILLPQTDNNIASIIVGQIKKACEEYATKSDKEVYYTSISLGYATKIKDEEPLDKVLKIAEDLMYRRKLLEYKSLHSSIISSIKTTMFEKSNETEEHAERIVDLSKKMGQILGLNEENLIALELVSTLHDIGKISIDQNILTKPGKLSEEEWAEVKKHPEVGYRIAHTVPELRNIAEYILCHHERWDGKGYPQGLQGEDIPLLSRIISVVDSYDAMTQDRSYRKAMSQGAAITEIMKNAGTQFDPEIARIFVEKIL